MAGWLDRDTGISVFRCLDAGLGEVIISQLLTAGILPLLATRLVPFRASCWSSSLIMLKIAHLNGKNISVPSSLNLWVETAPSSPV